MGGYVYKLNGDPKIYIGVNTIILQESILLIYECIYIIYKRIEILN